MSTSATGGLKSAVTPPVFYAYSMDIFKFLLTFKAPFSVANKGGMVISVARACAKLEMMSPFDSLSRFIRIGR